MKNKLPENIPSYKKGEINKIVKIIKTQFKPEFIILFGSYARGDFVEYDEQEVDGRVKYYESDFDILVVTASEGKEKSFALWDKIKRDLKREISGGIDLLVHNIQYVNEMLSDGVPFFYDVKKDGVVLFSNNKSKLVSARQLTAEERKIKAQGDFDYYMEKAQECFVSSEFCNKKKFFEKAAFELHQATENMFIAIQMVFTSYAPKLHDLEKLEKIVTHFGFDPYEVFPRDTAEEKYFFELLKKSYVESRYNPNFKITAQELAVLFKRVKQIEADIERLCESKD